MQSGSRIEADSKPAEPAPNTRSERARERIVWNWVPSTCPLGSKTQQSYKHQRRDYKRTFSTAVNLRHAHTPKMQEPALLCSQHSEQSKAVFVNKRPRQRWMNSVLISLQFYSSGKNRCREKRITLFFFQKMNARKSVELEVTWTDVQCRHFCPPTGVGVDVSLHAACVHFSAVFMCLRCAEVKSGDRAPRVH